MEDPADLSQDRLLAPLGRDRKGRPLVGGVALVRKLGAGGMGAVYKGIQIGTNRPVAVKILPFTLLDQNPGLEKRFLIEARSAAALNSDHVVRVYDVGCDRQTHFLVMEYVAGNTLGAVVRARKAAGGGLPEDEALRIAIAGAKGLAAAHAKGIVHRDVKPDNFLIPEGDPGRTKLADLGLAKPEGSAQTFGTMSHVAMGTPGFMAPEQAEDARSAGPAADVFAMGATIHAMLAGEPPFGGGSLIEVLRATASSSAPALPPEISPGLRWVVDRCLAKKPAQRFRDGAELLAALERVAEDPEATGSRPAKYARPAPSGDRSIEIGTLPERRASWMVPVAAAAVVVGVCVAVVFTMGSGGRPAPGGGTEAATPGAILEELLAQAARLERDGRPEDALATLSKAAAEAPDDPRIAETRKRIGEQVAASKSTEEKAEAWRTFRTAAEAARLEAESKDTPEAWGLVAEAVDKLAPNAQSDAEREEARARRVQAAQRRRWAGAIARKARGDLEGAIAEGEAALKEDPSMESLDLWIAQTKAEKARRDETIARKTAYDELSAKALAERDPARARDLWQEALLSADDPADRRRAQEACDALSREIEGADAAKKFDEAVKAVEEALAGKQWDAAAAAIDAARALRKDDPRIDEMSRRLAAERGGPEYDAAMAEAAAALKAGDRAAAREAYGRALAAKPGNREAQDGLDALGQDESRLVAVLKGNRITVVLDAEKDIRLEFVILKAAAQVPFGDAGGGAKRVKISKDFAIMTTEVTQEQWNVLMGGNRSHFPGPKHPVDTVTWWEVQDFLWKLNQRLEGWSAALPTDAQWQYACQSGGKPAAYGFGDDSKALDEHAWHGGNAMGSSHPVALKKPNGIGLYDMHGNAWEWCWDAWIEFGDIRETTDPAQSFWAKDRLIHGGASNSTPQDCRTTFRTHNATMAEMWEYSFRPILVKGKDPAPHVPSMKLDLGRGVTMAFRQVRAGTSPIGSEGTDRHMVTLTRDFWIAETETTQAQWEALMGPKEFAFRGADRPAESVTHQEAREFAKEMSKKFRVTATLPTEAEWEVACRGMTDGIWHSGNDPAAVDAIAWTVANAKETRPVRGLRPNAFGLYDMSGNVWEWVADFYEPWKVEPAIDPKGPKTGENRVLRGGCFTDNRELAASGGRMQLQPWSRQKNLGFRVVVR